MKVLFKFQLNHLIALNKTVTLETLYKPPFHYFQVKIENGGDEEGYTPTLTEMGVLYID